MSNLVTRFQLALLEQRTIRTIIWFVATGALLYLAATFWFGMLVGVLSLVFLHAPKSDSVLK